MTNSNGKETRIMPIRRDGQFCYNICLEPDFSLLPEYVSQLGTADRRICVITDSNVASLYAETVLELLKPVCKEISLYVIPAGEEHKNLNEIRGIYEHLILNRLDRKDFLVALGGGVTGDMTGFAAATYLRGIRFIQIPTTLLAQVDSSIGGKTGVDFDAYKNMVGAFHMPSLVYINTVTLGTLSEKQFACGMGEVLKHGLIKRADYYEWTLDHMTEIEERDGAALTEMVAVSCQIKGQVVENDPTEQGERALLNFGHTIGHAIEKLKEFTLPHGHCIALGTVAASWISWQRGLLSEEEFFEIRDMMVGFDLPISFDGISPEEVLAATKLDKKMASGQIRFILLKKIGEAYIDTTVTDEEILGAVRYLDADLCN